MRTGGNAQSNHKVTVSAFGILAGGKVAVQLSPVSESGLIPVAHTVFKDDVKIELVCRKFFDHIFCQIFGFENEILVLDLTGLIGDAHNINHNTDKEHQHCKQEQFFVMFLNKIHDANSLENYFN
jgi:hypothetical protein